MTTEFFHQDTNPNMIILTITTIIFTAIITWMMKARIGYCLTKQNMSMRIWKTEAITTWIQAGMMKPRNGKLQADIKPYMKETTTITPKWNTAGAKTPEAGFRLTDTDMRMREMEKILHK